MNFVQIFQKKNRCYRNAVQRKVEGIVLYVVRMEEGMEDTFLHQWNHREAMPCPHAVVQKERITQLLPWEYKGRTHMASKIHILLFLTKREGGQQDSFAYVYENVVRLCAVLCKKYSLDPRGGISYYSRQSSFKRFGEEVKRCQMQMDFHCLPSFLVIVTAPVVQIRSGPGERYPVREVAKREDVYRIISRKDGWGRLEENRGYLRLAYTKKKEAK